MKKWWEAKEYSRLLEVKKHKVGDDKILFLTNSPEYVDLAPPKPASEFVPAYYKHLQREWSEMRSDDNSCAFSSLQRPLNEKMSYCKRYNV